MKVTCSHIEGLWLVCGSEDGMVTVWRCDCETRLFGWTSFLSRSNSNELNPLINSPTFSKFKSSSSEFKIREKPIFTLHSHNTTVTSVRVSTLLDLVVSGSLDGYVVLTNLHKCTHLRTIYLPDCTIDKILINHTQANMVIYSQSKSNLYLYSINGNLLACQNVAAEADTANQQVSGLSALQITQNGHYLITAGGTHLCVRTLHNLQVLYQFENLSNTNICDIGFDQEERLLFVGLVDGKLGVYFRLGGGKIFL